MSDKLLKASCRQLAYSKSDELNDSIYEQTVVRLKELWSAYGYSRVLGELVAIWQSKKAVPFFERMIGASSSNYREIKTIATSYHKCYNGGVEKVQSQLMNLWVQMGYRVVLIAEEEANPLDYAYPDSVKRIVVPSNGKISDRLSRLQDIVLSENIDMYINHNGGNYAVLWECVLMKMLQIPYVIHTHEHFACYYAYGKNACYTPRIFKMCDLILSLSETNARFYQLCGCKSFLIQNPISEDLVQISSNYDINSKHILFVGRLSKEKRPMDAARIFKLIHEHIPDTVLDVVGGDEGDYIIQMKNYFKENDLSEAVVFHGLKSQPEVNEFYKNSAIMLFPSEMEGYPMVLLESKAYGLPCIMYDLRYLSLIKDGKGVMVASIGDTRTMATNAITLLTDDKLRLQYSNDAKESFRNFLSYDLESTWKNIISIVSANPTEQALNDNAYFPPDKVSVSDCYIEPMLFDAILKGYEREITRTVEYRLGYKILKIPRLVKKVLRQAKGAIRK